MSVTRWSAPPFTRRTASPRRVRARNAAPRPRFVAGLDARLLLVLVARPPGQPELTVAHVGRAQRGVMRTRRRDRPPGRRRAPRKPRDPGTPPAGSRGSPSARARSRGRARARASRGLRSSRSPQPVEVGRVRDLVGRAPAERSVRSVGEPVEQDDGDRVHRRRLVRFLDRHAVERPDHPGDRGRNSELPVAAVAERCADVRARRSPSRRPRRARPPRSPRRAAGRPSSRPTPRRAGCTGHPLGDIRGPQLRLVDGKRDHVHPGQVETGVARAALAMISRSAYVHGFDSGRWRSGSLASGDRVGSGS